MRSSQAFELHKNTPPNWYYQSIKIDPFQRYWHKRRYDEIVKLAEPVDGSILDIGCADGVFTKVLLDHTKAKEIIGLDVVNTSINWAKKHWQNNPKMIFLVGDVEKLNFKNDSFDAIFCLEVLEHVYQPTEALKEMKRVLKKGGYGVFLVPSESNLFKTIWFLWTHFYPRGWVWKETHIQEFRNNYLPKVCKKAGFKIEKEKKFILGMLHAVKVRKV